ncbi:MAG: ATP-dependent DNA helicase RecG [Bacilli bacterium]
MTLEQIYKIGPKGVKLLNKLGINNLNSLINFYPFRYETIKKTNMDELIDDKVIIDGIIETNPNIYHINKKLDRMTFKLNTGVNLITITIFNRGFLKSKLQIGNELTVIGKINKIKNNIVASDLRFGLLKGEKLEPIYHTTYGITSNQIHKYINSALSLNLEVTDYIPSIFIEKYKFMDKLQSIITLHNPFNQEKLKKALTRLKYEELFIFMLKMNYLKNKKNMGIGLKKEIDFNKVEQFINELHYKLTEDQLKSIIDIYNDLNCEFQMNRLLQGDVGSGKTIVAIISMYMNFLAGFQSALMVPTEILANQHFHNIKKLFEKYNIQITLLTGKIKNKEKKEIINKISTGEINFVIGTHAILTDNVCFNNLGLVITDEQHRFGVNQRSNLKNKGITPDILYMSATPIPRTYALTLYGDMDISSIKTVPNGRKEIITLLKKESQIIEVLESMFIELKKNHQIYVIAPLIEESENSDLKNVNLIEENMKKAFGKFYKIGTLHGKMKNNEKDEVMEKFKNNEIQILISTTVIEVGVDVPNSTMIVIFDSFRFGLSTLHQLRGRVGRNNLQSYCILISNKETERLKVLTQTNDGFKISEEDFLIRGSGDLFGIKQSGDMVFNIADLKKDYKILLKAKEDSELYLQYEHTVKEKNMIDFIINNSTTD